MAGFPLSFSNSNSAFRKLIYDNHTGKTVGAPWDGTLNKSTPYTPYISYIWYMDVSENSGTPKSSILIGFSIINHPFWGTPIFGNTHISYIYLLLIGYIPFQTKGSFGGGKKKQVGAHHPKTFPQHFNLQRNTEVHRQSESKSYPISISLDLRRNSMRMVVVRWWLNPRVHPNP